MASRSPSCNGGINRSFRKDIASLHKVTTDIDRLAARLGHAISYEYAVIGIIDGCGKDVVEAAICADEDRRLGGSIHHRRFDIHHTCKQVGGFCRQVFTQFQSKGQRPRIAITPIRKSFLHRLAIGEEIK